MSKRTILVVQGHGDIARRVYVPDGSRFPPVMGKSYLQRVLEEYGDGMENLTKTQQPTSFPFLKIARDFGVDYGEVIRESEKLDFHFDFPEWDHPESRLSKLEQAILRAILRERRRRAGKQ